jgi:hypothetical protein
MSGFTPAPDIRHGTTESAGVRKRTNTKPNIETTYWAFGGEKWTRREDTLGRTWHQPKRERELWLKWNRQRWARQRAAEAEAA